MTPSFLNLFMKNFTRERVVPIIPARVSWLTSGITMRALLVVGVDANETSLLFVILHGNRLGSKKAVTIRGLNKNHNHDLKDFFKGVATRAAATTGPFQKFYEARIASGLKPPLVRLTLARKIAAITLLVWKKGVRFDAEQLKQQAA